MYCPIINDSCKANCRFQNKDYETKQIHCTIKDFSLLGSNIIKAATIIGEAIKEAAKETNKSELDKCIKTFVDGSSALSIIKEE